MGMFAPEYKSPIPKYAMKVGIVTASTGAAIRDIINIARRRNPYVQLVLCPAQVQGEGAASSIARGIETLDAMGLDVLIVGRGGGSIEDLWAFNETDVTIADYVADLRAPTPSAAAELAVFDYALFEGQLREAGQKLYRALSGRKEMAAYRLEQYRLRLRLYNPERQLNEKRQRLADAEERMERLLKQKLTDRKHRLALLSGRLHGLSPLEKISKGFGFLTGEDGKRVESAESVKAGDHLLIRVLDGRIEAEVVKAEKSGI